MRRILCPVFSIAMVAAGSGAVAQQTENQAASAPTRTAIVWSFDPVNGIVHSNLAQIQSVKSEVKPDEVISGPVSSGAGTYTGTVNIAVTVNLVSTLPKGAFLRCSGTASLSYGIEANGPISSILVLTSTSNSESVDATVAGNTATCNFSIPYSWTLSASPGEKFTVSGVEASVGVAEDVLDPVVNAYRVLRSTTASGGAAKAVSPEGATTAFTIGTVL
jgi:hypothetical protein